MLDRGLVHVYCGNGKGKTTAAIGLGVRGIGSDLKVCMIQFLKTRVTGELEALMRFAPHFEVFRFETPKGFFNELDEDGKALLKIEIAKEFELAKELQFKCDILILDEVLGVLENKLLTVDKLVDFINTRPKKLELVITGRVLPEEIRDLADYVSEVICVKHPNEAGIAARRGIEY